MGGTQKVNRISKAFGAILVMFMLSSETISAAGTPSIEVNGASVSTDVQPYIQAGTTIAPLHVAQQIPGVSVSWNNSTKTVTITKDGKNIILRIGQSYATAGTEKIPLQAPALLDHGRVMVPLRFIAEASGAYVAWNPYTQTVYVSKITAALKEQLASPNLTVARNAALQLPRISTLRELPVTYNEEQSQDYYFIKGKADRFFIKGADLIGYYVIVNGHSELRWTGKLGYSKEKKGPLFFLPYQILDQTGTLPDVSEVVVFYHLMLPIGAANYGFIYPDGSVETIGMKEMQLHQVFEIEEE